LITADFILLLSWLETGAAPLPLAFLYRNNGLIQSFGG
jgi:hypothetical protein